MQGEATKAGSFALIAGVGEGFSVSLDGVQQGNRVALAAKATNETLITVRNANTIQGFLNTASSIVF
jgi:hypothetical protein